MGLESSWAGGVGGGGGGRRGGLSRQIKQGFWWSGFSQVPQNDIELIRVRDPKSDGARTETARKRERE